MKSLLFTLLIYLTTVACKKHEDGARNDNEIWLHNQHIEPYQIKISKGTTLL